MVFRGLRVLRKRLRPARGASGERGTAAPPSARERGWGPASIGKSHTLGVAVLAAVFLAAPAVAAERYALVISGASGGQKYAETYDRWRAAMVTALVEQLSVPRDHVVAFAEKEGADVLVASTENVRRSITTLRNKMGASDLLFVVLIGHGSFDGAAAKFNMVGPDLDSAGWAELFKGVAGRLILVNTTSASFPFLAQLSGRGRVIITSTDSAAQKYDTVFPEYFIQAFADSAADIDKNKRVSMWEAFAYASTHVKQWYEQKGQLATERPLLDDNGDGVGKEAGAPGPDGTMAHDTYLDAGVAGPLAADPAIAALQKRRAALESEIEALKSKKAAMKGEEYAAELERLLIELAKLSQQIKDGSY